MTLRSESREIEAAEKARMKREAFLLRVRDSYTYADIASSFGVDPSTIRTWVKEMSLIMLPEDELEEARAMNVYRIDTDEAQANKMIARLATMADSYQAEGKDVMVLVMEIRRWHERKEALRKERALIMGLNRPVKVEHMHRIKTEFDQEIEDLVASLAGGGILQSTPEEIWED